MKASYAQIMQKIVLIKFEFQIRLFLANSHKIFLTFKYQQLGIDSKDLLLLFESS